LLLKLAQELEHVGKVDQLLNLKEKDDYDDES
jgi:hypothetical protein